MSWTQKTIRLQARSKGCHLITRDIESSIPEIANYHVGLANIFLQHTSASLTINENADPDVRKDMNAALDRIAPERDDYLHSDEGPDDMTGHILSSVVGVSLNIPIKDGKLCLGTWQGIWLCEHRNHGGSRKVVITIQGEKKEQN